MTRVTETKKMRWISRLDSLKDRVNRIYGEISEHNIPDSDIGFLANMTCCFDDAMAEVDALPESGGDD